jgi:hypothetical protein
MNHSFVIVMRGANVETAELIAVSDDPAVVSTTARAILAHEPLSADPMIRARQNGERAALGMVGEVPA